MSSDVSLGTQQGPGMVPVDGLPDMLVEAKSKKKQRAKERRDAENRGAGQGETGFIAQWVGLGDRALVNMHTGNAIEIHFYDAPRKEPEWLTPYCSLNDPYGIVWVAYEHGLLRICRVLEAVDTDHGARSRIDRWASLLGAVSA